MKQGKCEVCSKVFYKYRKVLRFCSWKCSSETRKFKETEEYIEKIKCKIKQSIEICEKTGCWNFNANKDKLGRGRIWFRNTTVMASRVSYIIFKQEIPTGIFVCHKCDNYACVNPDHLFLGTCKDNVVDREEKKRGVKGEEVGIAKLKPKIIMEIFELRKKGMSQQKIAEKYGVSQSTIGRVLSGKTWRHLLAPM